MKVLIGGPPISVTRADRDEARDVTEKFGGPPVSARQVAKFDRVVSRWADDHPLRVLVGAEPGDAYRCVADPEDMVLECVAEVEETGCTLIAARRRVLARRGVRPPVHVSMTFPAALWEAAKHEAVWRTRQAEARGRPRAWHARDVVHAALFRLLAEDLDATFVDDLAAEDPDSVIIAEATKIKGEATE